MGRIKDQTKLKILLLLGGTISATAGAVTVLGVPMEVPALEPPEIHRPAAPGPTRTRLENRHGRHRTQPTPTITPARRFKGILTGPRGRLGATPVELVPLPLPGRPEVGSIRVLTDDLGRFAFHRPAAHQGGWALFVQAPGYGLMALPLPLDTRSRPREIRLTYSRWLQGRVRGDLGEGLAGALVKVGIPLEEKEGSRVLWLDRERTGREGRFTLRQLPVERKLFIMADHPRRNPSPPEAILLPREGPPPSLDLQLLPGLALTGRVRRRSGAAGTRIQLTWERILYGGARVVRRTVTDGEGRFTLAGLPGRGRSLTLWTVSPRGRRHRLQAPVRGGQVVVAVPW